MSEKEKTEDEIYEEVFTLILQEIDEKLCQDLNEFLAERRISNAKATACLTYCLADAISNYGIRSGNEARTCMLSRAHERVLHRTVHLMFQHDQEEQKQAVKH